jgi:ribose/xylose/arabinose/galactoside ABC-type transport system permease subunit
MDATTAAVPATGADASDAGGGVDAFLRRALTADWASAMLALVVLFLVIGIVHPEFLQPQSLINVVQQSAYVAVMAAGLVFLLTQTEVDLSVGGNYVLAMVTAALLMQTGMAPWVAAALALVAATGVGALNAFICQVVKIPSLIATLAMGWVLFGLASALSEGKQIVGLPIQDSFFEILGGQRILGFPVSVIVLIAIVAILTVVLRRTPFGFRVREIGSNSEAAAFSGIPVRRVKSAAFMLSGLLAGVAGMLGLAFFTSGDPTTGRGYELFAVAGAVIGGNPLSGGTATVFGAAVGAILLNAVSVGLVYFNIPATWSQFATGAVILAAVSLDGLVRSRRRSAFDG